MKTSNIQLRSLITSLALFGSFVAGANAAVMLTFDDSSGSVVATWSGSLNLAGAIRSTDNFNMAVDALQANNSEIYVRVAGSPSFDQYQGGNHINMGFVAVPSSHTMTMTFGYSSKFVMMDSNTPLNGVVSPTGTMTWAGMSMSDIGVSWVSTTPTTVYNTGSGTPDSIQFMLVPEPSSLFLLGLSSFAFALRRSRR